MARYQPNTKIAVVEPCSQDWETMAGDSRKRHCATCDRDVFNSASMTAREIEQILQADKPLPCMRLAQYPDGSLLVANEVQQPQTTLSRIGAAFISLFALSSITANAQRTPLSTPQTASVTGKVVDAWGRPAANAEIVLTQQREKGEVSEQRVMSDSNGEFGTTVQSGAWSVRANRGIAKSQVQRLRLKPGQTRVSRDLTLQPITVTAGVIAMVPPSKSVTSDK